MDVVVAGGTGMVGRALAADLRQAGHHVRVLTRGEPSRADEVRWDPPAGVLDAVVVREADAVVCLTGESIAKRWTEEHKQRLRDSRVEPVALLARAMAEAPDRPRVLVCASHAGYYGFDRGDERLTEEASRGNGFWPELVAAWEAAAEPARAVGMRVAHLRTGQVLSREAGLLHAVLGPFKAGFGTTFGKGRHHISWITVDDLARAYRHVLEDVDLHGPCNATAPCPVTQDELVRTVGAALGKRRVLRVPRFVAARILGGEAAAAVLTPDARVYPQRLLASGFTFSHADVGAAVRSLVG